MTIYDENNVPILEREPGSKVGLSDEHVTALRKAKAAALKAFEEASTDAEKLSEVHAKHYLLGESVIVQNPDPNRPPFTAVTVGASTLEEAVKETIQAFDLSHVGEPNQSSDTIHTPRWVASTHKPLARALADYYSSDGHACEVREIAEVLA